METTFISIHDLSPEARTLYASDSIIDILGYSPEEVVNRPCWDFFHPDEIPIARAKHDKGVELDKAAVLSYCRMQDKDGRWLGCEVIFTIVYDVLVSCTSIYRRGLNSQNRAIEAPAVRRLFSSSPQDPRYHMLSHISSKFTSPAKSRLHEPRSALFLNRYTRTLTIMYATNGLAEVLGLSGQEMIGKSFYYCIQENCLKEAVKCLENAKANDSIAYLRFWYRDPRQEDQTSSVPRPSAEESMDAGEGQDDAMGTNHADREDSTSSVESQAVSLTGSAEPIDTPMSDAQGDSAVAGSHTSSGDSNPHTREAIFGDSEQSHSSMSSMSNSSNGDDLGSRSPGAGIELEAVVSCTSDGLVVCLRRATSQLPEQVLGHAKDSYETGLFATPWAREPILPDPQQRPQYAQNGTFAPGLAPDPSFHRPVVPKQNTAAQRDFMNSIRDIAVFAWAVVGINGSLAAYGHGQPRGESQPASGLPVWQPDAASNPAESISHGPPTTNGDSGDPNNFAPQSHDHQLSGKEAFMTNNSLGHDSNHNGFRGSARTSGFGFGDPGLN